MNEVNSHLDANLLAYLVGGLEESDERRVEAELAAVPELRLRLDVLRLALEPLSADKDEPAPPRDLAVRTLARIAEHNCREVPRAPMPLRQAAAVSTRAWWQRVDVLIAACLLLTLLGIGAPALLRLRGSAARLECQNNLREFGAGLVRYRELHGQFPNIADKAPYDLAGLVVPILADAGVLSNKVSVRCPGSGPAMACPIKLGEALASDPQDLTSNATLFTPSYAYSLGFKDNLGYHPPCPCGDQPSSLVALMSDGPPSGPGTANSHNHGGGGQNILFSDGSVRFHASRMIGSDDIFTNNARQVRAGLDCFDIVLGNSASRP